MGKPKVYGKRTGPISFASFAKFTADSSGNETSPEASVLCEVPNNIRSIPTVLREPNKQDTLSSRKPTKDVLTSKTCLSQGEPPFKKIPTSDSRKQKRQNLQLLDVRIQNDPKSPDDHIRTVSEDGASKNKRLLQASCQASPRKPKPPHSEDLNVLFNSLRLNDQPESSIVLHQTSISKATVIPDCISPKTRSYLTPILSCKNVTPDVSNFSGWIESRPHLSLEKIGEGSFGEVFRASSTDGNAVILKLMPLNMQAGRGSKSFTSVNSASNEVRLLERMQRVPGFVEFRGACVLVGSLPSRFIELWREYKAAGRTVESRDPSKKTSYSPDQLWLLLEMSDAGRNLEPGQYAPPGETAIKGGRYLGLGRTWDIFWEVVKSIAKAECWAQFEHRDLHLGNVCAKDTVDVPDKEDLTFVNTATAGSIPVNRSNIEITIIDYSLSRAFVDNEEDVLFYDFKKDKHLLKGQGDLQYDMYRHMAAAVNDRSSKEHVPQTNIIWLWYLLHRLLAMTKELSSRAKAKKGGCITREARILDILEQVQGLTNPDAMQHWQIDSAAALLSAGIENGWLSPEDIFE